MVNKFSVSKYITLKLEHGKTNIYVLSQLFSHCKFLLLNIPIEEVSSFDEIDSIDEAAEKLDNFLEEANPYEFSIPSETEFWGHCSNLQVWYENDYDTRLLHRNLAFPLLKKLVDIGDYTAKRVFKHEIVKRLNSGCKSVIEFLDLDGYRNYLAKEDFYLSILDEDAEIMIQLERELGFNLRYCSEYSSEKGYTVDNRCVIELDLSANDLKTVPKIISKFKNIKALNFCATGITNLPEWIGQINSLQGLDVSLNNLTQIPDSIGNINSLEYLDISDNKIEILPNSIGNLRNLKELKLDFNKLTILPEAIGNLRFLEHLDIGINYINKLPDSIKKLKRLKKLIINNEMMQFIPKQFLDQPQLQIFVRKLVPLK